MAIGLDFGGQMKVNEHDGRFKFTPADGPMLVQQDTTKKIHNSVITVGKGKENAIARYRRQSLPGRRPIGL